MQSFVPDGHHLPLLRVIQSLLRVMFNHPIASTQILPCPCTRLHLSSTINDTNGEVIMGKMVRENLQKRCTLCLSIDLHIYNHNLADITTFKCTILIQSVLYIKT